MFTISNIKAVEILDSRGNPTVEVSVTLDNGCIGIASVPSGASTGTYEAVEKRDGDSSRYHGKGVLQCLHFIHEKIQPTLVNLDARNQRAIDQRLLALDGTDNKNILGANTILSVSLSVAHAAANAQGVPLYFYLGGPMANTLPVPLINVLNGGAHADNDLDIQEFMIIPHGASSMQEAIRWGSEVYHTLKKLLKADNLNTNVGDEGGFAPSINSTTKALDFLCLAIEKSGRTLGKDISLGLDVAASEFFKNGRYELQGEQKSLTAPELVDFYKNLAATYPIISIEDGMAEDDWDGWRCLTKNLGNILQIVGDDLFVTNPKRLLQNHNKNAANSILIKPNQIGTLTETWETVLLGKKLSMGTIMSHRSGETEDTTISDLSVAFGCGQIKIGAPCRTDRTAKYNRLINIESQLGVTASFAGYNKKAW